MLTLFLHKYEQDGQNDGWYGRPKSFDPSGFGWSPQVPYAYAQTGHPGYGYYQQQLPTVQVNFSLMRIRDSSF